MFIRPTRSQIHVQWLPI